MKHDGQTRLAEGIDFLGFAEQFRTGWYEQVLPVIRVDIVGEQALDGSGKAAIETVDQDGFEDGSFKKQIGLACRRIGRRQLPRRQDFSVPPFCHGLFPELFRNCDRRETAGGG